MTIKPALAVQWRAEAAAIRQGLELGTSGYLDSDLAVATALDRCAAALEALFTHADVDALRAAAEPFWETADTHGPGPAPALASLADRIEALLPPRGVADAQFSASGGTLRQIWPPRENTGPDKP